MARITVPWGNQQHCRDVVRLSTVWRFQPAAGFLFAKPLCRLLELSREATEQILLLDRTCLISKHPYLSLAPEGSPEEHLNLNAIAKAWSGPIFACTKMRTPNQLNCLHQLPLWLIKSHLVKSVELHLCVSKLSHTR